MHFRPRVCCVVVVFIYVWKRCCVPARVALQGRIHRSSPRTMRIFLVWKRRYADVRAGTQVLPLRVSFGWIVHGQAYWSLFTQKRDVS